MPGGERNDSIVLKEMMVLRSGKPSALVLLMIILLPAALTAVLFLPGQALAHGAFLNASVKLTGPDVIVSVVDPYGGGMEGILVMAAAAAPERPRGQGVRLQENQPGVFVGSLVLPTTPVMELFLEARIGPELFRAAVRVPTGEDVEGMVMPMVHVEQAGVPWTAYLYLAAVFLLGIGTALALRRKRKMMHETEEEE